MKRGWAAIGAATAATAILACSGPAPAKINGLELRPSSDTPGGVDAWVSGVLPEDCTRIGSAEVSRSGRELRVELSTITIDVEGCEGDINSNFVEVVPLDLGGLEADTYAVRAGRYMKTFDLEAGDMTPGGDSGPGETITGQATVETVTRLFDGSFPVLHFVAAGNLPDSCTTVQNVTQRREGNTIVAEITTARPADAVCAQVLVPFEEVIPVDTTSLAPGAYAVYVNGIRADFSLE